jgi:hypothetical protein
MPAVGVTNMRQTAMAEEAPVIDNEADEVGAIGEADEASGRRHASRIASSSGRRRWSASSIATRLGRRAQPQHSLHRW